MLIKTIAELKSHLSALDRKNKTLGLVPTMGYLHDGHISLIREAKSKNGIVVVSIFVNPTQFGPGEDFEKYPRAIERDYAAAISAGADIVFNPEVSEIYPVGASTFVEVVGDITKKLCGRSRPTHFKGVTTVVSILFNIVQPDTAYFGQKDAQQSLIIKKIVRDLHMPVQICVCPIVREADGLAMSSRNVYLSPEERRAALSLSRGLDKAEQHLKSSRPGCVKVNELIDIITREIKSEPLADIDYVQLLGGEALEDIETLESGRQALAAVAVRFGNTRLIDNKILTI